MSPSDDARDHGKADNWPCCPVSVLPDERFQSQSQIMSLSCLSFFLGSCAPGMESQPSSRPTRTHMSLQVSSTHRLLPTLLLHLTAPWLLDLKVLPPCGLHETYSLYSFPPLFSGEVLFHFLSEMPGSRVCIVRLPESTFLRSGVSSVPWAAVLPASTTDLVQ